MIFIDNAYYGFDQDGKLYVNTGNFLLIVVLYGMEINLYQLEPLVITEQNRMEHFIRMNGMKIQMEILIIMGRNALPMKEFNRFRGTTIILMGGRVSKNALLEIEGAIYVTDSDGKVTELLNNQWTQASGDWYYVKNEKLLRYCVGKKLTEVIMDLIQKENDIQIRCLVLSLIRIVLSQMEVFM